MLRTLLFAQFLVFAFFFSCSENKDKKIQAESEKAYEDLEEFVIMVEKDSTSDLEDTTIVWEQEADKLKERYYQLENEVDDYIEYYPPQQRETIQDFKERFRIALNNKQKNYDDVQARYKLRKDLLGFEVQTDQFSSQVDSENIVATYQHFVNTVIQNKDTYTSRDWELIEGWWSALEDRKKQVEGQLTPAEEEAIARKQAEYLELRSSLAAAPAPTESGS